MHIFKHLLILAILLSTLLSFGQLNPTQGDDYPYIEVTGTAEKEVIPDEIYIGIIIREKYVNREKISIEVQEEKLKNAVMLIGIDLKNLYLSDANADYVKIRWQKKDVITKKDYTLKVTNATEVGLIFQELEKLEITDAFISGVNHSQIDSLRKEVKITAIKDAKDKADYLLSAIGEQAGKPLLIKENEVSNGMTIRGSRSNASDYYIDGIKVRAAPDIQDNNDIQFQKIKIKTNIYVKFSIK